MHFTSFLVPSRVQISVTDEQSKAIFINDFNEKKIDLQMALRRLTMS